MQIRKMMFAVVVVAAGAISCKEGTAKYNASVNSPDPDPVNNAWDYVKDIYLRSSKLPSGLNGHSNPVGAMANKMKIKYSNLPLNTTLRKLLLHHPIPCTLSHHSLMLKIF